MSLENIAQNIALNYSILLYLFIAVLAFLESMPFFGAFFPGQLLIMISGFLARLGDIDIIAIIATAALFAFLGELYAFNIGKKHGFSLVKKYGKYVFITQQNFTYIKGLMRDHPAKSLILGRFNSLTRALSPFTAGASRVKISDFIKFSIIGVILWASSFTLLGYIFAESYKAVAKGFGVFIVTVTFLAVGILIGYRFMNKRKHAFSRTDFYKLVAGILSLYFVAKIAEDVIREKAWISFLDMSIYNLIQHIRNPIFTKIFIFLANIFEPNIVFIFGLVFLYILFRRGSRKRSFIVFMSLSFGTISILVLKALIHRIRPLNPLVNISQSDYSFPSGHAAMACIFFIILIYTLKHNWTKSKKILLMSLSVLMIILIGFSRIYLNAHWFSDVIAGYALGIFWVSLSILAIKYIDSEFKEHIKIQRK